LYGGFLAGTTLFPKSITYLQKAIALGVNEAHYGLAFVYLKQEDSQRALVEFKEYQKYDPENATAAKMVSDIENGKLRISIVKKPLAISSPVDSDATSNK
jgi:hypothetical protein